MKKLFVLSMGLCLVFAFSSCKSSESAYKKAYEKAKQQELTETPTVEATPIAPVAVAPVAPAPIQNTANDREENVSLIAGNPLKTFSVVVGSFSVEANARGLKSTLDKAGYDARVVKNPDRNMYRVIASSYDDRAQAVQSRDALRGKYEGAWLLYNAY